MNVSIFPCNYLALYDVHHVTHELYFAHITVTVISAVKGSLCHRCIRLLLQIHFRSHFMIFRAHMILWYTASLVHYIFGKMHLWWAASLVWCIHAPTHLWWAAYMMRCIYGVLNLWCGANLVNYIFIAIFLWWTKPLHTKHKLKEGKSSWPWPGLNLLRKIWRLVDYPHGLTLPGLKNPEKFHNFSCSHIGL